MEGEVEKVKYRVGGVGVTPTPLTDKLFLMFEEHPTVRPILFQVVGFVKHHWQHLGNLGDVIMIMSEDVKSTWEEPSVSICFKGLLIPHELQDNVVLNAKRAHLGQIKSLIKHWQWGLTEPKHIQQHSRGDLPLLACKLRMPHNHQSVKVIIDIE